MQLRHRDEKIVAKVIAADVNAVTKHGKTVLIIAFLSPFGTD